MSNAKSWAVTVTSLGFASDARAFVETRASDWVDPMESSASRQPTNAAPSIELRRGETKSTRFPFLGEVETGSSGELDDTGVVATAPEHATVAHMHSGAEY